MYRCGGLSSAALLIGKYNPVGGGRGHRGLWPFEWLVSPDIWALGIFQIHI